MQNTSIIPVKIYNSTDRSHSWTSQEYIYVCMYVTWHRQKNNNNKSLEYLICVLTVHRYFERQMEAAEATKLPLFLHCRNSAQDFMEIISRNRDKIAGGVVSTWFTLSYCQHGEFMLSSKPSHRVGLTGGVCNYYNNK